MALLQFILYLNFVMTTNLDMINKMKENIKLTDIYIKPDISNYGVISFDKGQEIIKKGEEATLAVYEQVKKYGNPKNYEVQNHKKGSCLLDINDITTTKLDNYTRAYILGKLRFKSGKTITYDELKTGINNNAGSK